MDNRTTRCLLLGTVPMLLVAFAAFLPAADDAKKQLVASHASAPAPPLIWPLPPLPPRVRWVSQISRFTDVAPKRKKSWYERMAGVKEEKELKLDRPYGVATDSKGRIYVADYMLGGVVIFDRNNKVVEVRKAALNVPLMLPVGLAVDAEDRLFVSDAQGRAIFCFAADGKAVGSFGLSELDRPAGIAIDNKYNRLYVADTKGNRVAVYDSKTFKLQKYIGARGEEPGQFLGPSNVAVDKQGNLYVTDSFNRRIEIFDRRGRFLRAFGEPGDGPGYFTRPKGIALDSQGHIYVVDTAFGNFQIFSPQGELLLFVGSFGPKPGELFLPAGIYIDGKDQIYVTEQYIGRLQIFQYIPQSETEKGKEVMKAAKTN